MIHSLISFQYDHPLTGGPIRCSNTSQAAIIKKTVAHDEEANDVSNLIPCLLPTWDPHAAPSLLPAPAPCSERSHWRSHSSSLDTSDKTQTSADHNKGKPIHTHIASRKRLLLEGKKPHNQNPPHHTLRPPSHHRNKSNSSNSLSPTLQWSSALP